MRRVAISRYNVSLTLSRIRVGEMGSATHGKLRHFDETELTDHGVEPSLAATDLQVPYDTKANGFNGGAAIPTAFQP